MVEIALIVLGYVTLCVVVLLVVVGATKMYNDLTTTRSKQKQHEKEELACAIAIKVYSLIRPTWTTPDKEPCGQPNDSRKL